MEDRRIKEILIEKNREFRRMFLKHQEFEQQLVEIDRKIACTEEEIQIQKDIKKRKLRLKDKMQEYIIEYRRKVN